MAISLLDQYVSSKKLTSKDNFFVQRIRSLIMKTKSAYVQDF